MKKQSFLLALLIILISSIALAEFDAQLSFDWLINQAVDGSYNNDLITTSFATITLQRVGAFTRALEGFDWIDSQKTAQNCWPKPSCKIKQTAFALLTLNEFNENIDDGINWLTNAQSSQLTGEWLLQIVTQNTGVCKIYYNDKEKTINVAAGKFPDCGATTFLDLNGNCLEPNLIRNNPSIELDIRCNMDVSAIQVIYKTGNTYYLYDNTYSSNFITRINNGCFGKSAKTSCDYETTLYVNWILKDLQKQNNLNSILWLKLSPAYDRSNTIHNALLYLITGEKYYADVLKDQQILGGSNAGSWNRNYYDTSFAILALKEANAVTEVENAKTWLRNKQLSDGSWAGSVLDTAVVLFSAFTDIPYICTEYWDCTEWSDCIAGQQTRTCTDLNDCGTTIEKPDTIRECTTCAEQKGYVCKENEKCLDNAWLDVADTDRCCSIDCINKTCVEQNGSICTDIEICPGDSWLVANDTDTCCKWNCTIATKTCFEQFGYICTNEEICEAKLLNSTDTHRCCSDECTLPLPCRVGEECITIENCPGKYDKLCECIDIPNDNCPPKGCTPSDECQYDYDCPMDEECDLDTCTCISIIGCTPSDECQYNYDCAIDEECDLKTCTCVAITGCTAADECQYNYDCAIDEECDLKTCICIPITPVGCTEEDKCRYDYECEKGERCNLQTCECEEIPKEKKGFPWWIIILIAALAVGGYLFYKKFMAPPPTAGRGPFGFTGKPSTRPKFPLTGEIEVPEKPKQRQPLFGKPKPQPTLPLRPLQRKKPIMTRIEEELGKSIEEAKKLLGRK